MPMCLSSQCDICQNSTGVYNAPCKAAYIATNSKVNCEGFLKNVNVNSKFLVALNQAAMGSGDSI